MTKMYVVGLCFYKIPNWKFQNLIGNKFACAARLYGLSRNFDFLVSFNLLYWLVCILLIFVYVCCQITKKHTNKQNQSAFSISADLSIAAVTTNCILNSLNRLSAPKENSTNLEFSTCVTRRKFKVSWIFLWCWKPV